MKMLQDGINKKYDLILTKSISRFARNTVDTLKYVRILKENNIAVLFEEENINTLEMTGELLLTILSSVAQQESENISTHVKLGLKMKKERGELIGFNNCLGYQYQSKSKQMIINQEDAETVKLIFKLFCEGYGAYTIAKKLTQMNIRTPKGKEKWCDSSVYLILRNEKYKGDVLQGKTYTVDPISHKRVKNMGEEDKYYISDHHEPIISADVFDKVQEILKQKCGARATGRRLGNVGRKFTLSNRLRCGYCGNILTRRSLYSGTGRVEPAWLCVEAAKKGKMFCDKSKIIKESVIEKAFLDAYEILCQGNKEALENLLDKIKLITKDYSVKERIKLLQKNRREIENRKKKTLDLLIDEVITKEIYETKVVGLDNKIIQVEKEIEQLELLIEDEEMTKRGVEKIKEILQKGNIMKEFDKEVFDALIDYVIIGGYNEAGVGEKYMLRFICKNTFKGSLKKDIIKEDICKYSDLSKIFDKRNKVLLDFVDSQSFYSFERDKKGILSKKIINNIRVRVEFEM